MDKLIENAGLIIGALVVAGMVFFGMGKSNVLPTPSSNSISSNGYIHNRVSNAYKGCGCGR